MNQDLPGPNGHMIGTLDPSPTQLPDQLLAYQRKLRRRNRHQTSVTTGRVKENMHGFINSILESFIVDRFGDKVLLQAREACGFASQEGPNWKTLSKYSDASTNSLVGAVCALVGVEATVLIEDFGSYFMETLRNDGYGNLLRCQGSTLRSWLDGVNDLHAHLKSTICDKVP